MDRFKAAVSEEMAALKDLSSPYAFESAQEYTTEWTLGHRDLLVHSTTNIECFKKLEICSMS